VRRELVEMLEPPQEAPIDDGGKSSAATVPCVARISSGVVCSAWASRRSSAPCRRRRPHSYCEIIANSQGALFRYGGFVKHRSSWCASARWSRDSFCALVARADVTAGGRALPVSRRATERSRSAISTCEPPLTLSISALSVGLRSNDTGLFPDRENFASSRLSGRQSVSALSQGFPNHVSLGLDLIESGEAAEIARHARRRGPSELAVVLVSCCLVGVRACQGTTD